MNGFSSASPQGEHSSTNLLRSDHGMPTPARMLLRLLLRSAQAAGVKYLAAAYDSSAGPLILTTESDTATEQLAWCLRMNKAVQVTGAKYTLYSDPDHEACLVLMSNPGWESELSLIEDLTLLTRELPITVSVNSVILPRGSASAASERNHLYGTVRLDASSGDQGVSFYCGGLPAFPDQVMSIPAAGHLVVKLSGTDFPHVSPATGALCVDDLTWAILVSEVQRCCEDLVAEARHRIGPDGEHVVTRQVGRYASLPCPGASPASERREVRIMGDNPQLVDNIAWDFGRCMSLAAAYVYSLGWPVLDEVVDEPLLNTPSILSVADLELIASTRAPLMMATVLSGPLAGYQAILCEHYTLTPLGRTQAPVVVSTDAPAICEATQTIYLTPDSGRHMEALLQQAHDYRNASGEVNQVQLRRDAQSMKHLMENRMPLPAFVPAPARLDISRPVVQ